MSRRIIAAEVTFRVYANELSKLNHDNVTRGDERGCGEGWRGERARKRNRCGRCRFAQRGSSQVTIKWKFANNWNEARRGARA